MNEKIVVPALGESVTEATIAKWLKSVGDTVEVDEPIVELETDKVNLEVPSPVSGTIGDIKHKDGEVVEVGAVLGSIQANGNETVQEIKKEGDAQKVEGAVLVEEGDVHNKRTNYKKQRDKLLVGLAKIIYFFETFLYANYIYTEVHG